ncbi:MULTISPECIES: hypothetical protein [unclassified Nocardioides]|uniref:hypothetical protein n=1 Tax=unclassified Nocardioides TaxID=2615069 RepID=UPI0007025442|nr:MULTISPECIES: hypothetical protein [unclassified Nocardioides]KRC53512.1 hypothetical protein ASE19_14340 [Nocardioides sp. Root79]KRC68012.1 hypothetical protein ASE20_18415 [Nocardioides sp. Root240]
MTSAQLSRRPAEPRLVDEPSVRLGLGGFALFAAAGLVAAIAPPAVPAATALVVLAAAWSLTLPRAQACLLGLAGWAFAEGFALHQYGELQLAPSDLALLGAAVLACLAASMVTAVGER